MNKQNAERKEEVPAKKNEWRAKVTLEVEGPEEGPVVASVEYEATSEAQCKRLQETLAKALLELN